MHKALCVLLILHFVIGRFNKDIMRDKLTSEQYAEIKEMKPEDRVADFGDGVTNRIMGILIAYSKIYDIFVPSVINGIEKGISYNNYHHFTIPT